LRLEILDFLVEPRYVNLLLHRLLLALPHLLKQRRGELFNELLHLSHPHELAVLLLHLFVEKRLHLFDSLGLSHTLFVRHQPKSITPK